MTHLLSYNLFLRTLMLRDTTHLLSLPLSLFVASPLILVSFKDNVSCHWNIVFQMLIFKHMSVGGFGLRNSCLSEPSKPPKYGRLGQEIPKYCCSHEIVTVSKTKKKGHTKHQRAFTNYTSGTVWFQAPFFCISILERLGMQLTSSPSLTDG